MSDLSTLSPQTLNALPLGTATAAAEPGIAPQALAGLEHQEPTPVNFFAALLASVLPEISGKETPEWPVTTAENEPPLPEVSQEACAAAAAQFMASLLSQPLPTVVSQENPSPMLNLDRRPGVASQPVIAPAQHAVTAQETAEPAVPTSQQPGSSPKSEFLPLHSRPMAHKEALHGAMQAGHPTAQLPVVSSGQPHSQLAAPLRLDNGSRELPMQLHQALGDRLNIQINNQIQHATIRLDPPDMGKIEISLHFDAGKLQVQINAGQGDVYRALQQVSQELRQSLTEQHFVDVDVQVLSQNPRQQGQGQGNAPQGDSPAPVLANDNGDARSRTRGPRDDASILMTI